MSQQQPPDLGKQINQVVQRALNSKDFTELKHSITEAMQDVKKEINSMPRQVNPYSSTYRQTTATVRQPSPPPQPAAVPPTYVVPVTPKRKLPGQTAGTLLITFGLIGGIPLGIATLVLAIRFALSTATSLTFPLAFCLSLFLIAVCMVLSGSHIRKRLRRFRRYQQIMQGARYYDLSHLAAATAQSKKFLVRDIRRMIQRGFFSEAYLDRQETTLILDRSIYQQYLAAEAARCQPAAVKADTSQDPAIRQLLNEGRGYIRQIKEANAAIPDIAVSDKLYRLEEVTSQIFSFVETHPEKQSDIRKLMSYYLPTTLKLVNAYRDFDRPNVTGDNIAKTKEEIVDVLDTINGAFQTLLESLYEDDVLDISTDISALGTILRQDGLADDEITSEK